MLQIRKFENDDIEDLLKIIRSSFKTVADELNLTIENAPTNPAFLTRERLTESLDSGTEYFIAVENGLRIGCVALERDKSRTDNFFIERLAVIPEYRHNKYGKRLLDYAVSEIRLRGGSSAGIAVINENSRLKEWYLNYGFSEDRLKKFDHLPFTVCFMSIAVRRQ